MSQFWVNFYFIIPFPKDCISCSFSYACVISSHSASSLINEWKTYYTNGQCLYHVTVRICSNTAYFPISDTLSQTYTSMKTNQKKPNIPPKPITYMPPLLVTPFPASLAKKPLIRTYQKQPLFCFHYKASPLPDCLWVSAKPNDGSCVCVVVASSITSFLLWAVIYFHLC